MTRGRRSSGGATWGRTALPGVALLALVAAGVPGSQVAASRAQEAAPPPADRQLTVERIYGTADFLAEQVEATWRPDGESWITVEPDSAGRSRVREVDASSGERRVLVSADELVPPGEERPLDVYGVQFSPDGRQLLLFTDAREVWRERTKGRYWSFDLGRRILRPLSEEPGWQMFARFSPDGRRVAFVREHDLFVVDLETGEERALTTSGSETIINGTTDWVYEEELGLRDAFRWSPDGRRIAFWQLDQSPVATFYLLDQSSLYPELMPVRYPKAGTRNSRVRVGCVDLEGGATTWFETGPGTWSAAPDGDPAAGDRYLARMEWVDDSTTAIQRLNRHQDRLEILLGHAATGETRVVFTERDSAWVDVDDHWRWMDDGRRFIWSSEDDGYNHLYLYRRDGTLVRRLTDGEWPVTDVYGVDPAGETVYFQAARTPLTRQILAARLDGTGLRKVAAQEGWNEAQFSPDLRRFIHTRSTAATPPVVELRRADGEPVRRIVDNAALRATLDSLDLRAPEFFTVEAADGTPLNAWMIRPPDFDPEKRYPLLMYVYGGPGAQTVTDSWGGTRYLWHQLLARRGVLVASVDNRGTGARGRAFTKQVYLRLGQLESADQLAARERLAGREYVDGARTALWGWSYGGYMTLLTLLREPEAFAAGASVAPVTAWELYDTIYTERYMRTPEENPGGYRRGAPLTYAGRLEADLLLVHGTGDDNVHLQNTLHMVNAFVQANRQFRMRVYPGSQHGIAGSTRQVNLFGMLTDHLLTALGAR